MAVLDRMHVPVTPSELPWAFAQGAIGGIIAGLVFAAFEMIVSAVMMGADAFFMPLRMIGGIMLGPVALEPTYSLFTAASAGVVVHLMLAVIYGVIFAAFAGGLRSATWDVALGAAFGFALWLINFYLIAPLAFPWFQEANPMVQFLAHTFFFGAVLGWYIWSARPTGPAASP